MAHWQKVTPFSSTTSEVVQPSLGAVTVSSATQVATAHDRGWVHRVSSLMKTQPSASSTSVEPTGGLTLSSATQRSSVQVKPSLYNHERSAKTMHNQQPQLSCGLGVCNCKCQHTYASNSAFEYVAKMIPSTTSDGSTCATQPKSHIHPNFTCILHVSHSVSGKSEARRVPMAQS